jgi:hypothetical protein
MIAVGRQAFDRRDAFALGQCDGHDACPARGPVDMHRAGSTGPDAAAELSSRQAEMLANDPQQRDVLGSVKFGRLSIDEEFDQHAGQPLWSSYCRLNRWSRVLHFPLDHLRPTAT